MVTECFISVHLDIWNSALDVYGFKTQHNNRTNNKTALSSENPKSGFLKLKNYLALAFAFLTLI